MKTAPNLREQIHDSMLAEILQGNYDKNTPITEKQLIEKYQVSKSPIRDALIELCNEGILQVLPRFGYMIQQYNHTYVENICNFRALVEPRYLDQNWDKFNPANIKELKKLALHHEEMSKTSGPVGHWQMNSEFHLALASVYGDDFFYGTLEMSLRKHILAFSQSYWDYWNRESIHLFPAQHTDILDLIEANDKEKALSTLAVDISTFRVHS